MMTQTCASPVLLKDGPSTTVFHAPSGAVLCKRRGLLHCAPRLVLPAAATPAADAVCLYWCRAARRGWRSVLESLAVAARMQAGAPPSAGVDHAGGQARLDPASLERVFGVLAGQAEALARLQV